MTKPTLRVDRDALAARGMVLPSYASRFSRRDCTQPQFSTALVLRQFLRTNHREIAALVTEWRELCQALGLGRVHHYSTLAHVAPRLLAGTEKGAPSSVPRPR